MSAHRAERAARALAYTRLPFYVVAPLTDPAVVREVLREVAEGDGSIDGRAIREEVERRETARAEAAYRARRKVRS